MEQPSSSPALLTQSQPLRMPKEVEDWLQTLNPGLFQNYKDIEGTWNHPLTQFSVTLVSDSQFRGAVSEISAQDHSVQKLVTYELGLIVIIWVVRAWRLSKAPTWLLKLWTQAWIGAVFWVFSLLVVPLLAWGTPFKTLLSQSTRALIHHFF